VGHDLQRMILVTVTHTQGSVPREAGTWMAVTPTDIVGTLGGGNVEYQAIHCARQFKPDDASQTASIKRFALGPSLGQCCGGVMDLSFEVITISQLNALQTTLDRASQPIALFGCGHVGRAITSLLATLPYRVTWIDSRDEIFPATTNTRPNRITCEHSDPVQSAVATLELGSQVLIMSFSHAEDLEIVQQCLIRNRASQAINDALDLPFIGLIGSKTKWATFQNRLRERGFTAAELAQVTCPIGIAGISGKEPEVIAVAVAAQLLQQRRP
jgi:xanthine dehydrogenase accessory factor